MITDSAVAEQLIHFTKNQIAASFTGKVISVDIKKYKAVIGYNDLTYDVKLCSVINCKKQKCILIPVTGSFVSCVSEGNSKEHFQVIAYSEVEQIIYEGENVRFELNDLGKKIEAIIGETSLLLNENGIVFNQGKQNGIPLVAKLVDRINTLENSLNGLKQILSTWIPVPQDGGAALKSAVTAWAGSTIIKTTINDIENPKIKQ